MTVRVTWASEDGAIALSVADTGIGMKPEDIPNALTPFSQIGNVYVRDNEGTGLGLPIARHLAELHGARLVVESEVGVGTTVTVEFPAERVRIQKEIA